MVSLYVTCKDMDEARKIAEAIMAERAAGCVNMFPVESVWRNDETDALERTPEAVLIIKTIDSKMQAIEDIVRRTGSYKAPCVASFPVARINREYKEWLGRVVA